MNDKDARNISKLSTYVPPNVAQMLFIYLKTHKVHLKIKKPRSSKLGDYRHPHGNLGHRISVNGNLNQYAFLVTLLHEMAHLETWVIFGNKRVLPHGKEWKQNFQKILKPYIELGVFPNNIHRALNAYIQNPAASSCADLPLARALAKFDDNDEILVENLKEGILFTLQDGRVFKMGKKLRKRYKCLCVSDKRWYYVSPLATVTSIESSEKVPNLDSAKAV